MADISPSSVPGNEHFYRYLQQQKREDAAVAAGKASSTQTERIAINIDYPEAKDYLFLMPFPNGATISEVRVKTSSGTCTVTPKINATAFDTGSVVASSGPAEAESPTSANVFGTLDNLVLSLSSVSADAEGLSVTLTYAVVLGA